MDENHNEGFCEPLRVPENQSHRSDSKLASRIREVCDAGMIDAGSERGDDSAELPAWLADAVRRWGEWPEWKRAAIRALVEANDAVR